MHEDLIHCLDAEHENDRKITFEYPENDLDVTTSMTPVKKKVETPNSKQIAPTPLSTNETKEKDLDLEDTEDIDFEDEDFDEENEEIEDNDFYEEPKKKNTLIIVLASLLLLLLIAAGIFWLITTQEVEDVSVPNVVGMPIEEAIEKLTQDGFTYTTEQKNSDTIEEGKVIKTNPRAGSTRKKGDTVTLYESIGGNYYYLEDYINKNYNEIKAKLELLEITVHIEKKEVENPNDYKGKEDLIIEQKPVFNKEQKTLIEKGDEITLYIPDIVDSYPDMVNEAWNLSDVIAFVTEYKITLIVQDSTNKKIPEAEYDNFADSVIIKQSLPSGYTILEGVTFKVTINDTYETEENSGEASEETPEE